MKKIIRYFTIGLGIISSISFIVNYFIFAELHPKMVHFETISQNQENLLFVVGIGLLVYLVFYISSILQLLRYLKNTEKITLPYLLITIGGVLSMLFVFADFALLTDIHKQYKFGLDQPEWSLVYPIMAFQFVITLILTYIHISGFNSKNKKNVVKDSNVFLIAQYVGIICGLMGLISSGLGFIYPRAWNLHIHTTIGSIILLIPYFLIVAYWLLIKFRENIKEWYDEKQMQDIGKSSFITLIASIIFMVLLFAFNYNNLDGVISMTWLPLYIFWVLTSFSFGNLYFNKDHFVLN